MNFKTVVRPWLCVLLGLNIIESSAIAQTSQPQPSELVEQFYLCESIAATGFSFDPKVERWKSTDFIGKTKFWFYVTLIKNKGFEQASVMQVGSDIMFFENCSSPDSWGGSIQCKSEGGEWKFDKFSRNYLRTITPDFPLTFKEETPMIEIGNCKLLD